MYYGKNVTVTVKRMLLCFFFVDFGIFRVHPAAGFINYEHHLVLKFVIDSREMEQCELAYTHFKTTVTKGMKMLIEAFKELQSCKSDFECEEPSHFTFILFTILIFTKKHKKVHVLLYLLEILLNLQMLLATFCRSLPL